MRFCRFNDNRLGLVRDTLVHDVTAVLEGLPALRWPTPPGDHFFNHFDALRPQSPRAGSVKAIDVKKVTAQVATADDTPLGDEPAHGLLTPAATLLAHTREEQGDIDAATQGLANLSGWAWSAHGEVDNDLYAAVLRPYRKLCVAGAGPQLSGEYMVSRVMHRLGDAAYRQSFSLVRNARSAAGGGLGLPSVF